MNKVTTAGSNIALPAPPEKEKAVLRESTPTVQAIAAGDPKPLSRPAKDKAKAKPSNPKRPRLKKSSPVPTRKPDRKSATFFNLLGSCLL